MLQCEKEGYNMIYCNLAKILKEERLSVLKLAERSGLSRTAINPLYHNTGSAVHFETIEKICKTLEIGINELFSYSNLAINVCISDYDIVEMVDIGADELDYQPKKNINIEGILTIDDNNFSLIGTLELKTGAIYSCDIGFNNTKDKAFLFQTLTAGEPAEVTDFIHDMISEKVLMACDIDRLIIEDFDIDEFSFSKELYPIFNEKINKSTIKNLLSFIMANK